MVKLEDAKFEKHFSVYSSDQVEARYLLSPSLMEKIVAFRLKNGIFWMSFFQGNIYLALPIKKNLFEPNLFKSALNTKTLKTYVSYLLLFISLVDEFEMNNRIWLKE